MEKAKKKKKFEQRLCSNNDVCAYSSYFGNRCLADKRVIWRTCRFKLKPQGEENGKDK